ncbi:MAG: V-type ATPase subunit [Clostridia bacterium]|nr:V-type ATPase subunit [Clostridia bacterium]
MGYLDITYTNGVIAAREKKLLQDKVTRLCELNAEDAFRALLETGFGGGAETTTDVYAYETLIAKEEESLDDFIREYAPSEAERAYLLSSRDFHNAKALLKAAYLNASADKMLAPEGLISAALLQECVQQGDFSALKAENEALAQACEDAAALLAKEANGAKVGEIFEKALYTYLYAVAKKKSVLKKLLTAKADMTNILTAFRAGDAETATDKYLPVGSLTAGDLAQLFDAEEERAEKAFSDTPYAEFVKACFAAKKRGAPLTAAERIRDGYDETYFQQRRFELTKNEPFLYYVYRRRMECANVRIVFVCLLAGLSEHDVKNRLRAR